MRVCVTDADNQVVIPPVEKVVHLNRSRQAASGPETAGRQCAPSWSFSINSAVPQSRLSLRLTEDQQRVEKAIMHCNCRLAPH